MKPEVSFPGPICKANNISKTKIEEKSLNPIDSVSCGLVFELKSYADERKLSINDFVKILALLNIQFENVNPVSVNSKLQRLIEQKKKLQSKKKVKGVKNLQDLFSKEFLPPLVVKTNSKNVNDHDVHEAENEKGPENSDLINSEHQTITLNNAQPPSSLADASELQKSETKNANLLQYSITKLTKSYNRLLKSVEEKKQDLEQIEKRMGHYAVRNVNKRDTTARENLTALRKALRLNKRNEEQLAHCKDQTRKDKTAIKNLTFENDKLLKELSELKSLNEIGKEKKISLQKSNSYLKKEIKKMRNGSLEFDESVFHSELLESQQMIQKLKIIINEKDSLIETLENDLNEKSKDEIKTKNENGSYRNCVRLCVMELAGLEVAVEKVSPIIKSVCHHIVGREVDKSNLPCPQTVQAIIDEGHFVVKSYIASKLDDCQNWGLSRDGTTRRKQKILDTSVTLDSGDVMSLGFNRVHRETADAINEVTKTHLKELETVHETIREGEEASQFVARSLEKLSFTMSDRASNEKKADRLLDEWRDNVLSTTEDKETVHHFHCMAHTLLAFHSYTSPGMKELEKELVESMGALGRDSIPYFKFWSKKETVAERTARSVSDVFGPSGDHHGLRDKWDAYCAEHGIKSCIGNYKDNRFNSLFETSVQTVYHRKDFLHILDTVEKPNMLLQSVKADLNSETVVTFLQCYALFYLKVTGPYWNLITSGKVHYLELSRHIQELTSFLEQCIENPKVILNLETHWSEDDPLEIREVKNLCNYKQVLAKISKSCEVLHKMIRIVARSMIAVIKRQLPDFLEGGRYFENTSEQEIKRIQFASVTNLSCEHHFGDLDSSQKRRPNASLHHHSSVQLLKRNRRQLFKWIGDMDGQDKEHLLKTARKGGKKLRQVHRANENNVLTEINSEMLKMKVEKRKRKSLDHQSKKKHTTDVERKDETFPDYIFRKNDYVVIAYQDNWYPGIVEEVKTVETATVKFMCPCKQQGHFQWPRRDDKQLVHCRFILETNVVPDLINSGRQYYFRNHEQLQEQFENFESMFFIG